MLNCCIVKSKVGPLSSRTYLWSFWCTSGTMTSGIKVLHAPIHSFICSVLRLRHEIHVLQAMNAGEVWQRGYDLVCFLARYIVFYCWAGHDEAQAKPRYRSIRYPLATSFASWVGTCTGIVGPFKHLLHVTAHPQFLVLELWAPMGNSTGQYGRLCCIL